MSSPRADSVVAARLKRPPPKVCSAKSQYDVYVTNSHNVGTLFERCRKLLVDEDYPVLFIHGLGPACHIALTVALKLQHQCAYLGISVETYTDTVRLTDDLIDEFGDLNPGENGAGRNRLNSALHLIIRKS